MTKVKSFLLGICAGPESGFDGLKGKKIQLHPYPYRGWKENK